MVTINLRRWMPALLRKFTPKIAQSWLPPQWLGKPTPVYNLGEESLYPSSPRALISYLVTPFSISRNTPEFLMHNSIWHAHALVNTLNNLGFIVDVVDYRDTYFRPRASYDLFLGHGGINFERIARNLHSSSVKIYFSTGSYWKFHNDQERARFDALYLRRGLDLPLDRYIHHSEENALKTADAIIGIGNKFTQNTYFNFTNVFMINGAILQDNHIVSESKDFPKVSQNFLYFAGGGCVHKGLDLLLDAFSNLKQHLWIAGYIEPAFAQSYVNLLKQPNIHLLGWVPLFSPEFYKLMDTCAYSILPSCSEGQAQSIIECMKRGLLPLVTPSCGIDIENFGFLLEPCTIPEIIRQVHIAATLPANEYFRRSQAAKNITQEQYSEIVFQQNLKTILEKILTSGFRRDEHVDKN